MSAREVFGLSPFGPALRQCLVAIRGDARLPPTEVDASSLALLSPRLALPLWLGVAPRDRRVRVTRFFNRNHGPRNRPHSVRLTDCRDFRGARATYDGHTGTDFAVPPGTEVVAAAPGIVRKVYSEMNRGGLKVVIEHGHGLITTSNHLARALVRPGDRVARGQTIALSGMSGVDGILFFPWLAPHVHWNVLLAGEPVDPFAAPGEVSLFRTGDDAPLPHQGGGDDEPFTAIVWDRGSVDDAVAACRDETTRARLRALPFEQRALEVCLERVFAGAAFDRFPPLCAEAYPRTPHLDLPFRADDWSGVAF